MPSRLPPHFLHLVEDAVLKSFWYKKDLKAFLRRSGVAEPLLAQLSEDERKTDWIDRVFPVLEATDRGQVVLQQIAVALAEQATFPGLERHEDAAVKIIQAKAAVNALKAYLAEKERERQEDRERETVRQKAATSREQQRRSQATLSQLNEQLNELAGRLGTPKAGYDFQGWFYDLMNFFEVDARRPYVIDGRQIDGSITVDGTTYLAELKFTAEPAGAPDIDTLLAKVNSKADNTMGVMVSMSGFTSVAVEGASFAKTPLLLFDYQHLYNLVLSGVMTFPDVVKRVRRHSSQTGEAFLPVARFGG